LERHSVPVILDDDLFYSTDCCLRDTDSHVVSVGVKRVPYELGDSCDRIGGHKAPEVILLHTDGQLHARQYPIGLTVSPGIEHTFDCMGGR
jgi:hypothetical protein